MKLIVDGDMLLFRATAAVEKEAVFGRLHVLYSDFENARGVLEDMVADLEEQANTEEVIFALSDSANWRRNIFKEYKGNRKDSRKPLAYYDLEDWVKDHYETMSFKGVEADDVMGIYADRPDYAIWSLDKDMMQCPGTHLIDDELVYITREEGDRFHMYQTLIGDTIDNYAGCPGVGPKIANDFLDKPYRVEQVEQKNRTVWKKRPTESVWEGVVSLFEKVGLTEQDALIQARVARILRDGEYDFEKERVKLWTPR